jgi:hypothetical protein
MEPLHVAFEFFASGKLVLKILKNNDNWTTAFFLYHFIVQTRDKTVTRAYFFATHIKKE